MNGRPPAANLFHPFFYPLPYFPDSSDFFTSGILPKFSSSIIRLFQISLKQQSGSNKKSSELTFHQPGNVKCLSQTQDFL